MGVKRSMNAFGGQKVLLTKYWIGESSPWGV